MGHDTGVDLYAGYLSTYGRAHGIAAVVLLTVVATSLSMAIRHQRHLAERPADLLRLPLFIVVSTLVLIPIRLVGFIRLAHAGSWGHPGERLPRLGRSVGPRPLPRGPPRGRRADRGVGRRRGRPAGPGRRR